MLLRSFRLIEIVRLAMQGPLQALLLCSAFFISDFTSWLSLSVVTLLVLRNGLQSVALICLVLLGMQFLPGLGLRVIDVLVLLTLLIAGQALRATLRLDLALMITAVVGCVSVGLVQRYADHLLVPFSLAFKEANRILPELSKAITEDGNTYVLRSLGSWVVIKASLILLLARYWQSVLFNPQGFRSEFLALRMPMVITLVWVLVVLLVERLPEPWRGLSSCLNLPLLLTGIAGCHWAFTRFAIKKPWRILFYLLLVVIYPLVVLIGVMDSLTDIRQRLALKSPAGKSEP